MAKREGVYFAHFVIDYVKIVIIAQYFLLIPLDFFCNADFLQIMIILCISFLVLYPYFFSLILMPVDLVDHSLLLVLPGGSSFLL